MDLIVTSLNGTTEMIAQHKNLEIRKKLNGENSLFFSLSNTKENEHAFQLVEHESVIECDGQRYRVKELEETNRKDIAIKRVLADHIVFDAIDNFIYGTLSGTKTLSEALAFVLSGSGVTFSVIDAFDAKPLDNVGRDNSVSLLQKILNIYGAEMSANNNHIDIYKQVGADKHFQFRYMHNTKTLNKYTNTNNLSTYIKGFGKQNDDGTFVVEGEYISPNESVFGRRHAKPIYDDRFTNQTELVNYLGEVLNDEPEISYTIEFSELKKAGFAYEDIEIGDKVYIIHEPLNVDINARIVEYIEKPENPMESKVVISNIRENMTSILADFGQTQKRLNDILTENNKIKYSVLDEAVKRATEALNNSMTQLEYPVNDGIIARDPNNANNMVVFKSNGIGISTDGGATFKEAITSQGFVLSAGAIGQLEANNIKIGVGTQYETGYDPTTKADSSVETTVNENKTTWDKASNINSDGTFNTTKLTGVINVATNKINSSSNFYWDANGLIAVDPNNANNVVKLTSGGLGVSTNGGVSYNNAITGAGIVATRITSGTLDASKITVANLSANSITSGSIDASVISVNNLNASNITTGTLNANVVSVTNLNASNITTGTLDASQVTVNNLNASNITAGTLSGINVIGATVKTASSGTRIEMNSGFADMKFFHYGLSEKEIFRIYDGVTYVRLSSPSSNASIYLGESGNNIYAYGSWDFSNASHNLVAKFG